MSSTYTFSNDTDLKPCPDTPNCVSSQAIEGHSIKPFALANSSTVDTGTLVALIQRLEEKVSVINDNQRIHAEFTSRVFGFVDDLDLVISQKQNIIHVRSASRTGHYDFGVNRRRIEKLRALLIQEGVIQ
ncbi:MAG: hypothetical protein COB22_03555 [Cycloclasticus sp.]|nr:MAG: hypothetical protein COB22_03555 [Cycloclasticus sp.]